MVKPVVKETKRPAVQFRRDDAGEGYLIEGPADELVEGEVVGVEKRDGGISWVLVERVLEEGQPPWADCAVALATFVRPARWRKEGDAWLVSLSPDVLDAAREGEPVPVVNGSGELRRLTVDPQTITAHPEVEGWYVAQPQRKKED
jgi:hypothetical protein